MFALFIPVVFNKIESVLQRAFFEIVKSGISLISVIGIVLVFVQLPLVVVNET